jgi:hypothetical protein
MLFILNRWHLAPVGYLLVGGIASTAIELLLRFAADFRYELSAASVLLGEQPALQAWKARHLLSETQSRSTSLALAKYCSNA